ncbi:hypothetical protein G6O67_002237 [Ophiocordyceps sinensis]|uniref:Putative 5'-nucleotidase C-terminal domain-containing protein n=1 Tax=Ophiocordyceps sinensis TaxID=72228 RepID=A0A8H4PTU8_9HYPO|nr:hypothetical protein G6O67_002237 [Ophiocordyceps sinensis]
MFKLLGIVGAVAALLPAVTACGKDDCYGPVDKVEHVRHVKRMQPGAPDAAYGPKAPLQWGQINFLHTTDTHGWLVGHLKEKNYGADWGDFVTFTRRMKQTAGNMGVDLLLVDTGDLHDGTGLSDATKVDGTKSMPIFDEIDYDLLSIGNHELYVSEVAYQMFNEYARKWGDKYVTSNVQVLNQTSGNYEYVGVTHRYFTTAKGLRIKAFGVLFDFTGNSNASRVIKAKDMVKENWFTETLAAKEPVDMFVLFGHNPVRQSDRSNTLTVVFDAIRAAHPETPVQIFGGHTHIRDLAVYDDAAVGLESGRYCETLGWLSMSGFDSSNSGYCGVAKPRGVETASRPARKGSKSPFVYSRRYLDWNRKTFIYHSNNHSKTYDDDSGQRVTSDIAKARDELRLRDVYGCAPQDWCMRCAPFNDDTKNIFPGVVYPAASTVVVNKTRADKSRIVLGNTGVIRFDLHKGPFTYDDSFIISPFRNVFLYVPDVAFDKASRLIQQLNKGPADKRHLVSMPAPRDECTDPTLGYMTRRDLREARGVVRRQEVVVPGYATSDDWGDDGDDTEHSEIPSHEIPGYWEAHGSFPENGSKPDNVDVIFTDFIKKHVLENLGEGFSEDMVQCYIDCSFTSQDFLLPYAKLAWQANKENCPVT